MMRDAMRFQSWSKICRNISLLVAFLLFLPQFGEAQVAKPVLQEVREIIQRQFEADGSMRIDGRDIQTGKLATFYQKRDYVPV